MNIETLSQKYQINDKQYVNNSERLPMVFKEKVSGIQMKSEGTDCQA